MKNKLFFKNVNRSWFFLILSLFVLTSEKSFSQYSGSGTFTKITSMTDLTDGYYVIAYGTTFAMNNTNGTNNYFGNTAITLTGGTTVTNPSAAIVWKIQTDNGGRTIFNESSAKYVSYTGSSNQAQEVASVASNNQRWTFAFSTSVFTITNLALTTRLLQYNTGSPRFACYTGSQQNITLYKMPTSIVPSITSSLTASATVGTALTSYTITASNTPTSFTATNLPAGLSFSSPSISGTPTAAGTFNTTITATNSGGTDSKTLVFTIAKGTSSITATGTTSYTYTGSAQGPATNTKSGSSGAVTYSYSGVSPTVYGPSSTAPNNVGTYEVIASVAADANYNSATSAALAFSISKANSSITATGSSSFTYNSVAQGPASASVTGSIGAITYSYSGLSPTVYGPSATAPNNVGTYEVIASVAADANYNTANSTSLAFSISPKALTISGITADNKAYDGTSTASISGTASLVGIVGSEDVTLTGTPTATFVSSAVGVGIDVTVSGYSITGAAIGNYTLTQPTLSANIIANTPTLFSSGTLAAVNATYGTASATPSSFSVSGQSLTSAITVTAPTGFEVSLSSASAYASSISIGAAGNVPSTLVYVRLTATNAIGSYSGNISLSSTDATTLTLATASSTVSQKQLTISGLTGVDKTYDNTTVATVSGSAILNGVVGNEDVSLNSSAATYTFSDANAGTAKSITVSGYTITGADAANYSVSQPTGITATINKVNQTISAIDESQTLAYSDGAPLFNINIVEPIGDD